MSHAVGRLRTPETPDFWEISPSVRSDRHLLLRGGVLTDLLSTLRMLAWGLGLWFVVSVVSAVVISLLFRARARANDLLALDERRQAFIEAATSDATIRS
jgi:hypothetical protein